MVAVESTFHLRKDGIVVVNIMVRGRVMDLQSNATNLIKIASKILVAKEEDVAVVTVKVIRESSIRITCYFLMLYIVNNKEQTM